MDRQIRGRRGPLCSSRRVNRVQPSAPGELAEELPISRPTVSRHLRLLKEAGLVADRAAGTRRLYRLDDAGVEAVREYLEDVWGEATARFRLLAENTSERTGRDAP
jgi:DNA-binding transcriptional ArsR family regulator